MIHKTHFLQRHFTHAFSEILVIVQNENPEDINMAYKPQKYTCWYLCIFSLF